MFISLDRGLAVEKDPLWSLPGQTMMVLCQKHLAADIAHHKNIEIVGFNNNTIGIVFLCLSKAQFLVIYRLMSGLMVSITITIHVSQHGLHEIGSALGFHT